MVAINRLPGIRDSLVVAQEAADGDKRLVAYLVVYPDFHLRYSELRDLLRAEFPEYMLPAAFVRLEEFPITAHGKVDRRSLPEPGPHNTVLDEDFVQPRTATEKQVAKIIAGLLKLEEIGIYDNFFLLGGHSLLGTELIARLHEHFGLQIPLRTLFNAPTVAELSSEIDGAAAGIGR